jgi:hypothetical protein
MNTREKAAQAVLDFLGSTERVMLLDGTHMGEKHPLALTMVLRTWPAAARVLFRVNSKANAEQFLAAAHIRVNVPRPGAFAAAAGHRLYVDTVNRASWAQSPNPVDAAIVYPVGSMNAREGDECVHDLLDRGAKKIILVTWVDNKDLSWAEQFKPVRVTYDTEAEDPDHHAGLKEIGAAARPQAPNNLPQYARNVPPELLVRRHCDHCCSSTWSRLNKPYPGPMALRNAPDGEYRATCLKCGTEAGDNYNWYEG